MFEFGCICDAASPLRGAAARPASSARGHNGGRRICAGPAAAAVGARGERGLQRQPAELERAASSSAAESTAAAPPFSLPPPSGRVLALLLHGRPQARRWLCSTVVLPGGGLQLPRRRPFPCSLPCRPPSSAQRHLHRKFAGEQLPAGEGLRGGERLHPAVSDFFSYFSYFYEIEMGVDCIIL